ncbi:MAG: protein kinase [Fuerstiella sp.]
MSNIQQQNNFEQIQKLCREFRRQLRSGAQKRIEDYLDRVYEDSREMLFQNLLHIEIEFQRRQGREPASEEYIKRFPQHAKLVRQAFFESTMMSMSPAVETPADEDTVMFGMPAARKLGDYELLRELGRGGFGVVYEARHLKRGDVVALKTLPSLPEDQQQVANEAERLHKFRREFRSLAEVNHPNLVGMQTLEVDGSQWFFTMDVIDGTDFLDYVRPQGHLNEARLRSALSQLAGGILALHERGIVHRDLKPGNVLIAADGHVTIMDFGLVAELQQRTDQTMSMHSRQFVGTPRYAAPEQIMGARTMASDWYALGTLLYEALTGEPPFRGSHVEVLLQKQNENAPALVGRTDIPRDLAVLVDQLLQRDPEQRPPADLIVETLCPGHESRSRDSRSHDSTDSGLATLSGQTDSLLVGRESQLAELEQAHHNLLKKREPQVVFIRGRSGEGKTALAEKFLQKPRLNDDMVVLSGRCYDRESVPFKAIDCLIDALVAYLRSKPGDDVCSLLPDDIPMLAQLFPVLRRVETIAERSTHSMAGIDSRQIRYRAFAALRELLATIGQSTPLILFVDDLQWGDADSATALAEILKPPEAPAVMLLGSYRSDEAEESPFLQEWNRGESNVAQTLVEISALTPDQCAAMLSLRLGIPAPELREQAQQLWQSARGNPYFLDQLLEGFDAETGQFTAVPLTDIVRQRLSRLPQEAAALLEAVAVAGQAVSLTEAAGVTCGMDRAFATVTHMRSEQLVRLIGSDEQQLVDTYHDKIRETVLETMPAQQQKWLHVQFGELLEQAENLTADIALQFLEQDPLLEESAPPDSDRIVDLAFHFHAAGDERGFAYQFLAGELSFRAYASEDALEFLKRADRALPANAPPDLRFRVHERLARTLHRLRDFDGAVSRYESALKHAHSALQRAHVYEGIGTTHVTRSEFRLALKNSDNALEELGLSRPRGGIALVRCLPEFLRLILQPPTWKQNSDSSKEEASRYAIAQQVYNYLIGFIWELPGGMASYPFLLLNIQNSARHLAGSEHWGKGVTHSAGQIALNGLPWMGRWILNRSQRATEQINDAEMKGLFLAGSAMANHYSNDAKLADRQYEDAFHLLLRSGNQVYTGAVAHMQRHLRAVIAPSSRELRAAKRTLDAADDKRTQCWGHYDIASALARAGDIPQALDHIESARRFLEPGERYVTDAIFLGTEGYVRLQASTYDAARFSLEAVWYLVKKRKLFMDVVVRALPSLIESLVGPEWTQPVTGRTAKRLRRLCRVAAVMDWLYPNIASPAQRARGRAFAAMGKSRKAIRCFHKAVRRAESFGADYDRARSLLDLAAVEEHHRDERRAEAIELLKQQESVLPWAERWLLGEQFDEQCIAAVTYK